MPDRSLPGREGRLRIGVCARDVVAGRYEELVMPQEVFQFEDVTVDLRRVSVWRAGQPVALEPKTFDVLRYLIEHRDRLVTKEELLDTVWKDTFVTPNVLTRAVAQLRKALGDDAFEARYVETVAKRGYRFIAPVEPTRRSTPRRFPPLTPAHAWLHRDASAVGSCRQSPLSPFSSRPSLSVCIAFGDRQPACITRVVSLSSRRGASQPAASPIRFHRFRRTAVPSRTRPISHGAMEIYTAGFTAGSNELAITQRRRAEHVRRMVARRTVDCVSLAQKGRHLDRAVERRRCATGRRFRIAGVVDARRRAPRVHVRRGRHGGAVDYLDRASRRHRSPAVDEAGRPRGGHSRPSVSPTVDLSHSAVSQGHIGTEVWTMPTDGQRQVTKLGDGASPHFSPDGSAVYWMGRTSEGNDSLMRVDIDAARRAGRYTADRFRQFAGTSLADFSIARDGTVGAVAVPRARRTCGRSMCRHREWRRASVPSTLTADDVRNSQPHHSRDGRMAFHQVAP